ncbi:hypothetical protein [Niveibacterium sp.]|uniref:hypothetical protein n=1 Tax=Niveibacterium sp. TaxID=2017444 RepID=UPI0035B1F5C3
MSKFGSTLSQTANVFALYAWLIVTSSVITPLVLMATVFTEPDLQRLGLIGAACLIALWRFDRLLAHVEAHEGVVITAEASPDLHKLIDKVVARTGAAAVAEVRAALGYGIAVVQVPRPLARSKRTLVIGFELMQALDARTLAIQIQHALLANHGRIASLGWHNRHRTTLLLVADYLQTAGPERVIARVLLPFLRQHAQVMIPPLRQAVFRIDRMLAKKSGAESIARALSLAATQDHLLSEFFWPSYRRRADFEAVPTYLPHAGIRLAVQAATPQEVRRSLARALMAKSDDGAMEPTLRERLEALGEKPRFEEETRFEHSAATRLLRERYGELITRMDQAWLSENKLAWSQQHASAQAESDQPVPAEEVAEAPKTRAPRQARKPRIEVEPHSPGLDTVNVAFQRSNLHLAKGSTGDALKEAERWAAAVAASGSAGKVSN